LLRKKPIEELKEEKLYKYYIHIENVELYKETENQFAPDFIRVKSAKVYHYCTDC
jgi:hypothetical protein